MTATVDVEMYERTFYQGYSEEAFQKCIVTQAQSYGWIVFLSPDKYKKVAIATGTFHRARTGDKGFPDLVLLHEQTGKILYREVKTNKGTLEPDQKRWRDALLRGGHDWGLWRPRNYPDIKAELTQFT